MDKVCTRVPATFEQGSGNGLWKVQDSVCGRLKQASDISCALCSLNHLTAYQTGNYDWPFGTLPFGLFNNNNNLFPNHCQYMITQERFTMLAED